jgi:hypothetical protein
MTVVVLLGLWLTYVVTSVKLQRWF